MSNADIFKERVKALCKAKGVSQKFVSEATGHGAYFLNDIWLGKRNTSDEDVKKIASALGTTPEYLSGETDEPNQTYADINSEDVKYFDMFRSLPSDNKEIIKKLIEQMSEKG